MRIICRQNPPHGSEAESAGQARCRNRINFPTGKALSSSENERFNQELQWVTKATEGFDP